MFILKENSEPIHVRMPAPPKQLAAVNDKALVRMPKNHLQSGVELFVSIRQKY